MLSDSRSTKVIECHVLSWGRHTRENLVRISVGTSFEFNFCHLALSGEVPNLTGIFSTSKESINGYPIICAFRSSYRISFIAADWLRATAEHNTKLIVRHKRMQ